MGGVIVDLLTPCLIFGKIIPSFDLLDWQDWVPVFFFTFCKFSYNQFVYSLALHGDICLLAFAEFSRNHSVI